jgi:hypothetical protein
MKNTNYVTSKLANKTALLAVILLAATATQSAFGACPPRDDLKADSIAILQKIAQDEGMPAEDDADAPSASAQPVAYNPGKVEMLDHKFHKLDTTAPYLKQLNGVGILTAVPFNNKLEDTRAYGSATLIGSCYVLTNKHVVKGTAEDFGKTFQIGDKYFYSAGQKKCDSKNSFLVQDQEATLVTYGAQGEPNVKSPTFDWALLKLKKPVGNGLNPAKIERKPLVTDEQYLVRAGFPYDEIYNKMDGYAGVQTLRGQIVQVTSKDGLAGIVTTSDPDPKPGSSGGSLSYKVMTKVGPQAYLGGITVGMDQQDRSNFLMIKEIKRQLQRSGANWEKITEVHNRETCD